MQGKDYCYICGAFDINQLDKRNHKSPDFRNMNHYSLSQFFSHQKWVFCCSWNCSGLMIYLFIKEVEHSSKLVAHVPIREESWISCKGSLYQVCIKVCSQVDRIKYQFLGRWQYNIDTTIREEFNNY